MMAQIPLVSLTAYINRKVEGTAFSQLGNFLFWLTFCIVGQPCAVLVYYYLAVSAPS